MNSYIIVIFLLFMIGIFGWFGSELGYSINGIPASNPNALEFLASIASFRIDGMPFLLSFVFDCIPFIIAWIIYRQVRGQD